MQPQRFTPDRRRDHRSARAATSPRESVRPTATTARRARGCGAPGQDIDDAAFVAFLQAVRRPHVLPGRDSGDGFSGPQRDQQCRPKHAAPQRLPRGHQLCSAPARLHRAARGRRSRPQGGETLFTNQYRAFETLPPEVHEQLGGRTIRHVITGLTLGDDAETAAEHPDLPPASDLRSHRAVSVHPRAMRRDQRYGRCGGHGHDRVPVPAFDRRRTTPTGIPGPPVTS